MVVSTVQHNSCTHKAAGLPQFFTRKGGEKCVCVENIQTRTHADAAAAAAADAACHLMASSKARRSAPMIVLTSFPDSNS